MRRPPLALLSSLAVMTFLSTGSSFGQEAAISDVDPGTHNANLDAQSLDTLNRLYAQHRISSEEYSRRVDTLAHPVRFSGQRQAASVITAPAAVTAASVGSAVSPKSTTLSPSEVDYTYQKWGTPLHIVFRDQGYGVSKTDFLTLQHMLDQMPLDHLKNVKEVILTTEGPSGYISETNGIVTIHTTTGIDNQPWSLLYTVAVGIGQVVYHTIPLASQLWSKVTPPDQPSFPFGAYYASYVTLRGSFDFLDYGANQPEGQELIRRLAIAKLFAKGNALSGYKVANEGSSVTLNQLEWSVRPNSQDPTLIDITAGRLSFQVKGDEVVSWTESSEPTTPRPTTNGLLEATLVSAYTHLYKPPVALPDGFLSLLAKP